MVTATFFFFFKRKAIKQAQSESLGYPVPFAAPLVPWAHSQLAGDEASSGFLDFSLTGRYLGMRCGNLLRVMGCPQDTLDFS